MMRAWQESVATDKVLLDKVLGKAVGGCKTARLCLFSICNSDWVVIGECGWGGVYTGVLVAERRNTLGEQSQWCGKGEVLPVVELGETA